MRVHTTVECDRCGEKLGDVDLGPRQCAELKTAKKVGTFLGEVSVMFIRNALEHDKVCPKGGASWPQEKS